MKTAILVYKSKTGFTKKYAKWIEEELNCNAMELEDAHISEVLKYDIIIFGGGMHANRINGIKFIRDNIELFKNKHIIIFATGATPASAIEEVKKFEQVNIPSGLNIPFFYFQSGMNYKDMRFNDRIMMSSFKFLLSLKRSKNLVEQGTMESISTSYDNSKQKYIEPLIQYVRSL
ncbi:flavodoxin domain-containing protein [Serpentinicella alkaliphila]|uniref:Menaquinone-dependent protoporphyrinogen IX oxidase n=1 Tax=Serpentinicella alkaliphila TaxID=1734049 RepID=A0A4R2TH87_9FIRM|nr:flavodoxin domain-containing protein [Serpentinicella alkaliphila]QUH26604.1 hypothetical protein HZR23_13310 [Serpentinicella alkaliphila]TCQ02930.1 menaquinone-dependent protoporphyrinogen IX oxidase [Serpentinicella alkaliphila]